MGSGGPSATQVNSRLLKQRQCAGSWDIPMPLNTSISTCELHRQILIGSCQAAITYLQWRLSADHERD